MGALPVGLELASAGERSQAVNDATAGSTAGATIVNATTATMPAQMVSLNQPMQVATGTTVTSSGASTGPA